MGKIIQFPTAKEDSDGTWDVIVDFRSDIPNISNVSFTLEDLNLNLPDPEIVSAYLDRIEKEITIAPALEHIRNLLEIIDYATDLHVLPDWHRDMWARAQEFYYGHYRKAYFEDKEED